MNEILQAHPELWILLCCTAFAAGFIDAIAGGGGLIQAPVMLIVFPHVPVATLLGTLKIPSFSGTSVAAWHYSKQVDIQWKLMAWVGSVAFLASIGGGFMVSILHNDTLKPIILFVLVAVAIYTYTRKNFGIGKGEPLPFKVAMVKGVLTGLIIGFYDGFIGPGAGSFLILIFVAWLHQDLLHASAHAKLVNLCTNLGSILFFSATGHIYFQLAIPMAACNMVGGYLGSKMALKKGNRFIRIFFLTMVGATILRFAWDVFGG